MDRIWVSIFFLLRCLWLVQLQLETVSSFKFLLVGRHFFMVLYMFFLFPIFWAVASVFLSSVKQPVFLHQVSVLHMELLMWTEWRITLLPCTLSESQIHFLVIEKHALLLLTLHVLNRIFVSTCCACLDSMLRTQSSTTLSKISELWVNSSEQMSTSKSIIFKVILITVTGIPSLCSWPWSYKLTFTGVTQSTVHTSVKYNLCSGRCW